MRFPLLVPARCAGATSCSARGDGLNSVADLALLRQKPGSLRGVMFITHRERNRRGEPGDLAEPLRATATDRAQRQPPRRGRQGSTRRRCRPDRDDLPERRLRPYSPRLANGTGPPVPRPRRRGLSRERPDARPPKARDFYIPDLSLEAIRVPTWDFR